MGKRDVLDLPTPPVPSYLMEPGTPQFDPEQGPRGTWIVRQYSLASKIFKASAFSQEYGDPRRNLASAGLWATDGAHRGTRHYDLRSPVEDLFRGSAFFWLRPAIAQEVHRLLDACEGAPGIEFVGQVAYPLMQRVMGLLLQTDPADGAVYRAWVEEHVRTQLSQEPLPQEGPLHYCEQLFRERRAHPQYGFVEFLLELQDRGHTVGGAPLSDLDLAGYVWSLIVAGTETTVSSLATALLYLSAYRGGVIQEVQADPLLIPGAVRETLRLLPAFWNVYLFVKEPLALDGVVFEPGQAVLISLIAANRDPQVFPEPLALDLHRPVEQRHLTFGEGIHRCLGRGLAQLVMEIALSVLLLERWDSVQWDANQPVEWIAGMVNRVQSVSFEVTWRNAQVGCPRAV